MQTHTHTQRKTHAGTHPIDMSRQKLAVGKEQNRQRVVQLDYAAARELKGRWMRDEERGVAMQMQATLTRTTNTAEHRAQSRERVQLITSIRRSGPLTRLDRSDATWLTGLMAVAEAEAAAEATLRSYTF